MPKLLRPPKLTRDEMRAEIDRLERANLRLRTKAARAAAEAELLRGRAEELERELARLRRVGGRGRAREIDPGDAVPPGVAVREPQAPDAEAKAAKERLETRLGGRRPRRGAARPAGGTP